MESPERLLLEGTTNYVATLKLESDRSSSGNAKNWEQLIIFVEQANHRSTMQF